jgi:hypothetical protein
MKTVSNSPVRSSPPSDRCRQSPEDDQDTAHKSDDHAEQAAGPADDPFCEFVSTGAVDEADRRCQRQNVPDRVAMLSQHEREHYCEHLAQPFGFSEALAEASATALAVAGVSATAATVDDAGLSLASVDSSPDSGSGSSPYP